MRSLTDPLPFELFLPHVSSCVCVCRCSLTLYLCQARDHGKSGSFIRSTALLTRSKLGTCHTPDMYSPTRQPAKRCREQSLWRQPTAEVERAACAEIDMARRPSSRTMPLARACGSVEGSTARRGGGAPTVGCPQNPKENSFPTQKGTHEANLMLSVPNRSEASSVGGPS